MRAVVQRVNSAAVIVDGSRIGAIDRGLLAYVGCITGDGDADADWIARKIVALRVFEDDGGKMNLDVSAMGGRVLLVPNFTLAADGRKGNRPGFDAAMAPSDASLLFEKVAAIVRELLGSVELGRFGAHMHVSAENDGPINLVLDTSHKREGAPR